MRFLLALGLVGLLGACGGGGGGGSGTGVVSPPTGVSTSPTPSPTPTPTAGCSLRERQQWAADQLNEWYLFPETLATGLNPSSFSTVDAYIDALTATARAEGRDRFFTYVTSIAEENAFFQSGSSAGFGVRFGLSNNRLFVIESFENAPGLDAGIDRGTEILAIGTNSSTLRNVADILTTQGVDGLNDALGPSTSGTARTFRVADPNGATRTVSVTKREFDLLPVSPRYGVRIIEDGGQRVGYINLRTFISTADQALRSAFAQLRTQGITRVIVDFRYNGGGLVSTAELMSDLLGRDRTASDVVSYTTFRPSKSSENETRFFQSRAESIAPMRVAFIASEDTASASEFVINATLPYLGASAGLIGQDTFGKPVGQIAIDRTACDDRLRVVAFATQNADRQGAYYNGLAEFMQSTCSAPDDIGFQLGDPSEASTRAALDFLAGRSCTAIAAGGTLSPQSTRASLARRALTSARPSAAQREVPGLY